jgi:hypothetical protein
VRKLKAGAGIAALRLLRFHDPVATTGIGGPERPRGLIMQRAPRLAVVLVGLVFVTACAARVHIADIQNRPDKYANKTVSVDGLVTTSFGVPLVPFQMYKVDDGSGEITVVSRGSRAPRKGARVQVKGRVDELGSFGGQSVGLHIQESDRKIKE